MSKPKLLVVLGAGSSVGQGIPSVGQVNSEMRNWAAEWARIYVPATNFFERLWVNAEECYSVEPKPALRRQPNFEKVLGDLVSFSNWMRPHPHGETLRFLITPGNPAPRPNDFNFEPSGMRFPEGDMFEHTLVAAHSAYLFGQLATYMRVKSRGFNRTSCAFTSYCDLFRALRSAFDVGIYSLNYDTVALEANAGMFYGFDTNGAFVASEVHARTQWSFIYHLHGSVHQRLNALGDRLEWVQDLSANFADGLPGRSGRDITDGKTIPKSTLIAGGWKLDQLQMEPYQTFYSSLVRHAYEADAILLGGYGFGDLHVNNAIRNRITDGATRPPVMILDWADKRTDPLPFRSDIWSAELSKTLGVNASEFAVSGHSAPTLVSELKQTNSFEVSLAAERPVAVWYGGFEQASARAAEIVDWLSGTNAALP